MKKNFISLATAGLFTLSISATAFASPATVDDYVNLRSAPSTSGAVYQLLKPGTSLDVVEKVNAYWLKVNAGGQIGYVSPAYITYGQASAPVTKPAVVARSVNFRSAPSTDSSVYQLLRAGTALIVLEEVNSYWVKASVNGQIGYLSPSYLTYGEAAPAPAPAPTPAPTPAPAPVTQTAVVDRSVNFRSAPSTSSSVYQLLKQGTVITVLEQVNSYWVKASVGGQIGYLSPSYITYGEPAPAPAPTPAPTPAPEPTPAPVSTTADKIIQHGRDLIGITHYKYGVNQPTSLMDCSAFTKYVFGLEGIPLKWGTRYQKDAGIAVDRSELKAGDLVFFRIGSATTIGHVGIYIGDGQFIHNSPSFDGVGISTLTSGYWNTHYVSARRVL